MAAGESAYDVARRQREKAERLARSAELWEKGAAGEVEVARVLGDLPPDWVTVHDLPWPGRPRANIDHVVIGPGGVYVVDAKNWSGPIAVKDAVLRQNGYRREEAVVSAAEAAVAIQQVVPTASLVTGVLCFVRDEPIVGWSRDVMVCSTSNLRDMLTTRPTVLTPEDVERCVDAVRLITRAEPSPRRASRSSEATPATPRRGRGRKRSKGRPVAALIGVVALLVAIQTGGLVKASGWFSQELVQLIAPDTAEPVDEPTSPPRDKGSRKSEKQKQRSDRG